MNELITVKNDFLREEYHRIHHSSGLSVYVFPKKLSTAYAALTVRFGSLDNQFRFASEEDFLTVPDGTAHFLEHKMFENEDHVDTFDKFAALGASANAYTSNDVTSYLFSTAGDVEGPLTILLDSVFHPYFTEKNVEKEQGIIAQEIKMYDDSSSNRLYYAVMELLYANHGIRTNICGSSDSIREISPEVLMRCYRAFYRPENMILIVCGDVSSETVVATVDAVLDGIKPMEGVICHEQEEPPEIFAKSHEFHMDIARPRLCVGIKDTKLSDDPRERERRALILNLAADLYFGESTEFFERLYDRGLISHDFSACYESIRRIGHLLLTAATDDTEALLAEIRSEFCDIAEGKRPKEADFERIRRVHYAEYIKDFDSTELIATSLLDAVVEGVELFDTGKVLTSITLDEVVTLSREFLREDRLSYAVVSPMKGKKENNA